MARTVNALQEKARKDQLVRAAYAAIYEHGYAAVTLADIARAAGVSKGTLVYYFGSKEALFKTVLTRFVRTIAVSTARAVRLERDPLRKLQVFVENQFYGLENTRRFYTVYLDFLSASTKQAELLEVTRAFFEVSDLLDLSLAQFGQGDDPQGQAWQLRALIDGLSIRFLFDPEADLEVYRARCLSGMRAILGL
ncbi:TetR/AcrR family transcriptional repressor of bet genes [Deinobacterium chartae]|uniref:TetR/AcrR family transcriptional repressor of bet genes n=1 Tax=Deinobacterium chartae TaxID=521158 RepID=A0A841HZ77_9DEIO|nr:TetR family transcriptional regulator [Deinobacterium chartae]MBB6097519.1 TetR/AcrR family transcriptional repressor of bet genes [Deinobacterium chartae]